MTWGSVSEDNVPCIRRSVGEEGRRFRCGEKTVSWCRFIVVITICSAAVVAARGVEGECARRRMDGDFTPRVVHRQMDRTAGKE